MENKTKIAEAMIKYGGSFVKKLGEALLQADDINAIKIKATFLEYWNKYKKFMKLEEGNLSNENGLKGGDENSSEM